MIIPFFHFLPMLGLSVILLPWAIMVIGCPFYLSVLVHRHIKLGLPANIFTTVSDIFPKLAIATAVGIGGMAGGIGSFLIQQRALQLNVKPFVGFDI